MPTNQNRPQADCALLRLLSHPGGTHRLEGIALLCPPLPGKAVKAALFYITQTSVSAFLFSTTTNPLSSLSNNAAPSPLELPQYSQGGVTIYSLLTVSI